jgi:hypothetical protein
MTEHVKASTPEKILMVATPCLGDRFEGAYFRSMLGLQARMTAAGVTMLTLTKNSSLIALARNDCAATFRRVDLGADERGQARKITHMIFIDSDVGFDPADVERMLNYDEPVIAGSYPLKVFNWREMAMLVKDGHPVNASLPAKASGSTIGTWKEDIADGEQMALKLDERGLCKVETVGTGFMMIKREVFAQLEAYLNAKDYDLKYGSLESNKYKTSDGVEHTCFFNTEVRNGRFIGEDVYFCQLLADAGIPILVDAKCKLTHTGSYTWDGGGAIV